MKIDASSTCAPGPPAGGVSSIPLERPPSCVSSDEEEKPRTAGARRARTRTMSGGSTDQEREKEQDIACRIPHFCSLTPFGPPCNYLRRRISPSYDSSRVLRTFNQLSNHHYNNLFWP